MPDYSAILGSNRFDTINESAAASRGTALTLPGANNTKGAYLQLVAATTFEASGLIVVLGNNQLYTDNLVDIAVGAGGSEQIIASNLLCSTREKAQAVYYLPIRIPVGSRIAARYQAADVSGGRVMYATATLLAAPFLPGAPLSQITTYGAATGDSGGTAVDPGGSANTKGSYAQIDASTSRAIRSLIVAFGCANNSALTAAEGLVDVAVGAAASEQIILPDLWIRYSDQENLAPCVYGPFQVNIPAGTRISVRAQCSITDATDRIFDVVLYGAD